MQYDLTEREAELVERYRELYPAFQETFYNLVTSLHYIQHSPEGKPPSPALMQWLNNGNPV